MSLAWNFGPAKYFRLELFTGTLRFLEFAKILMLMPAKVFAAGGSISTAEVNQATENVKNAIIKLAMPIGGILVFVSIVIIALKMIVNSNNANKRSESIGSLAWVCAGTMLLGLSLIISGIILSVATNGSGALVGG